MTNYNNEFKAWRSIMDRETTKTKEGRSVVAQVSSTINIATNPLFKDAMKEGSGQYWTY